MVSNNEKFGIISAEKGKLADQTMVVKIKCKTIYKGYAMTLENPIEIKLKTASAIPAIIAGSTSGKIKTFTGKPTIENIPIL